MAYDYNQLLDMWWEMRQAQEARGFTLTVRELCDIFKVASTSAALYRIRLLVEAGLVEVKQTGKKSYYRAKSPDAIIER